MPHVITTSYLTHERIEAFLAAEGWYGYGEHVILSPGRHRAAHDADGDLRFAWEEMPQQLLDEQAQKMQDSLRCADRLGDADG